MARPAALEQKCPACGLTNVGSISRCLRCGAGLLKEPAAAAARQCQYCQALVPGDPQARFCMYCGSRLAHQCPECSRSIPSEARFCPYCGRAVPP